MNKVDKRYFAPIMPSSVSLRYTLSVSCYSHEYPIYIGHELLSNTSLLRQHIASDQALIVTNETIAPIYLEQVRAALSSIQCDTIIIPDGEHYKNQQSLFAIYDVLIKKHHHRDTTLIALGGGVIGDLTGFAAATFQRGVRFIQLPTTLLAAVDASVGGKTAINHPDGKNMIGSFHQPHAVIIDVSTLSTLPAREFNAGMAEVIKYGLLGGGDFLTKLQSLLIGGINQTSTDPLTDLIADCCRIKADYVEEDEKEHGRRVLLNLGHTFGHALEAITKYKRWLHGEAVAIGLYCAALLSYDLGYLDKASVTLVDELLRASNLPSRIPNDINLSKLQSVMLQDKKIKNNRIRFVLLRGLGDCYLDDGVSVECVSRVLLQSVA
jgi:3-dehydroquinate synthase